MAGGRRNNAGGSSAPTHITLTQEELTNLIAQAVATYANTHTPAPQNQGVTNPNRPCTFKTFMDCKPHTFDGTQGAVGLLHWLEKVESAFSRSHCRAEDRVNFATGTFEGDALTWWNTTVQNLGQDVAVATQWDDFKKMLSQKYCPRGEIKKMEDEFKALTMKGSEIEAYTRRSNQLALLCPDKSQPLYKHLEQYIEGLTPAIQGMVLSANPQTIDDAATLATKLTDQAVKQGILPPRGATDKTTDNKRKWDNSNTENQAQPPQQQQKFETSSSPGTAESGSTGYVGRKPMCNRCNYHHTGNCTSYTCLNCGKRGHYAKNCRTPQTQNQQPYDANRGCFECGKPGHFQKDCPQLRNNNNNNHNGYVSLKTTSTLLSG